MAVDDFLKEEQYYALYDDLGAIFRRNAPNDFGEILKQRMQDYSLRTGVSLSDSLFVENEIRHFEAMINEIDTLRCVPDYVPQDPNYFTAKEYIRYLESIGSVDDSAQTSDTDKYSTLHNKLVGYITISANNLRRLVEGDNIQPGTTAKWLGSAADAYRFAYWLNPKDSPTHSRFKAFFNKNVTGVRIHANNAKDLQVDLQGSIWDVLREFRTTPEVDRSAK